MRPDDYLDDDGDERDQTSTRAIFASGWFRAVLVLGVLAITLVVAVPYVLRWMEPGPARIERQAARPVALPPTVAQAPTPVAPGVSSPGAPVPVAPPSVAAPSPSTPATPVPPPAPVSPAAPSSRVAADRVVPAPAAPERESTPAKPGMADTDSRKAEPATRKGHPETAPAKAASVSRGGDFWVQVGAFQRERNAEALARSIREEMKMPAQMSRRARTEAAPAPARHQVFVTDAPVGAVNAVLRGHGSAQAVRGGVAVQPPLELKDAVVLSRRLSGEGLSVKIRRVGGDAGAGEPATAYVVRVGGYATRAQAEAARRELGRKGLSGFVAEAPAR